MAEMISDETRTLVRLATESLRKDIRRQQEQSLVNESVPCSRGLREFTRLVDLYWNLADKIGPAVGPAMSMAMGMAECDTEPGEEPSLR